MPAPGEAESAVTMSGSTGVQTTNNMGTTITPCDTLKWWGDNQDERSNMKPHRQHGCLAGKTTRNGETAVMI